MDRNTAFRLIALTLINGDSNIDYAAVGKLLAARNPELFCEISGIYEADFPMGDPDEHSEETQPEWTTKVITHLRAGEIIAAIKEVRTANGLGLYEAKSIIDVFRGFPNTEAATQTSDLMSRETYELLQQLRRDYGLGVFP